MPNRTEELLESIDGRLKSLLRVMLEQDFEEEMTNKEKVLRLYQLGFEHKEMAEIVDTTAGSIRGTVSALRREGEID